MKTTWMIVAAVGAAFAGCLDEATPQTSQSTNDGARDVDATVGAAGANGTAGASGPLALHLLADGTLAVAAPTEAGWVAYPEPVNSPFATQHAAWEGSVPVGGNLTSGEIPIRLYLASSSANVAARLLPPFMLEDLAGLYPTLQLGEAMWYGAIDGPDVIPAGQVVEVSGVLRYDGEGAPPTLRPGERARLEIQAAYVHATGAAELRFVMGPDALASLTLPL